METCLVLYSTRTVDLQCHVHLQLLYALCVLRPSKLYMLPRDNVATVVLFNMQSHLDLNVLIVREQLGTAWSRLSSTFTVKIN